MKVYVTRYALTKGIIEREAKMIDGTRAIVPSYQGNVGIYKPDWHETKEEAIAHAESMRIKKIASLKKQIAKLEKMTFE